MRISAFSLLLGAAILTAASVSLADSALPGIANDYLVRVWDTDSGLPDNEISSIAQTPDGYLWIGTFHGGLARFDGTHFVDFDPANTPELRSIEIRTLMVDHEGRLWIGTVEGGLISYRDERFHFEYWNENTPEAWVDGGFAEHPPRIDFFSRGGWIFSRIKMGTTNRWETTIPKNATDAQTLLEDPDGVIWSRQEDGQVEQLHGNRWITMTNLPGLATAVVNTLATDSSGRLWAAVNNRLALWNGKLFVDMTPTNTPPNATIREMVCSPDGGFWVQIGSCLRKYQDRQWTAIVNLMANGVVTEWDAAGPNESFSILFADSQGGAWFWRKDGGMGHVSRSGEISWVDNTEGKLRYGVRCCFEDHEGDVWFGLNGGGLAQLRPHLFHTVWPDDIPGVKADFSVCEDKDSDAMWFGSAGKILRWQDDAFTVLTVPSRFGSDDQIKALPASDGSLWVGSLVNGLMKLKNGHFVAPFPLSRILGAVRELYRDTAGNLWIGNEFGLFEYGTNGVRGFTKRDGFTPAYVLSIASDKSGDIWVGTALGELRRLHAGKFETFLPPDSLTDKSVLEAATSANPSEGLKRGTLSGGERFCALHFDDEGVLWIGSLGGGLLRFADGHFFRFTEREGLPNDYISQILEDSRGNLWLGTRSGIVRVRKHELNDYANERGVQPDFITYGKNAGLPALECFSGGSQPGCWRARDGRLWFGTLRGAVWIDPARLRTNLVPPPVHIEDVLVDGNSISAKDGTAPLPAKIQIAAGRHYFEFKFCALSFVSSDNIIFKWRLQGLDENWVNGGARRSASYGYIPPGTYVFEVSACNNDGVWADAPASVAVSVLPYFWQTWWFKLAVTACLVAVAAVIYSMRIARLKALEQLRFRIARDLHDEVGANLGSISLLAQMMELTPSKTDASQIRRVATQTVDALKGIIWFIDPKYDRLSDLVVRLQETARVMLTNVHCTFQKEGDFDTGKLSLAFRRNFPLLFKEALHNLVKHSGATTAEITVRRFQNEFELRIKDNGAGFQLGEKNGSSGLLYMESRAKEIGGQLTIETSPGKGTIVTLTAPLP